MAKTNGDKAHIQSMIERLQAGIASIRVPAIAEDVEARAPMETVLATCDDYLKKLRVHHSSLLEELRPRRQEMKNLESALISDLEAIKRETDVIDFFSALSGLLTPENMEKVKRLRELKAEIEGPQRYVAWVGSYFWAEVRNRFPALNDCNHIGLRADWSLVAERGSDDEMSRLTEVLEGIGLAGLGGRSSRRHHMHG